MLTGHGLFCMARVESEKNLSDASCSPNEAMSFLKALECALTHFESEMSRPFTSTCPHCSYTLASSTTCIGRDNGTWGSR